MNGVAERIDGAVAIERQTEAAEFHGQAVVETVWVSDKVARLGFAHPLIAARDQRPQRLSAGWNRTLTLRGAIVENSLERWPRVQKLGQRSLSQGVRTSPKGPQILESGAPILLWHRSFVLGRRQGSDANTSPSNTRLNLATGKLN